MASVAQDPEAVVEQAVAQPVLTPLTASAVFVVLTIDEAGNRWSPTCSPTCPDWPAPSAFRALDGGLAVVAGSRVGRRGTASSSGPRPAELHPFRRFGG